MRLGEAWAAGQRHHRPGGAAAPARLYGLHRTEFVHILGAFPLAFPEDAQGRARKAGLLAVYDVG